MKFTIKEWKLKELYVKRSQIIFPVYQRQEVWSEGNSNSLLIPFLKGLIYQNSTYNIRLMMQVMKDGTVLMDTKEYQP